MEQVVSMLFHEVSSYSYRDVEKILQKHPELVNFKRVTSKYSKEIMTPLIKACIKGKIVKFFSKKLRIFKNIRKMYMNSITLIVLVNSHQR